MHSDSLQYKTAHPCAKDSMKIFKNQESGAFAFDARRLHRIHVRTIELLNQHFQGINHKPSQHEPQTIKIPRLSNFSQLRNRFFSLKPENQQQIAQQMKQVKLIYKEAFRSEQLKQRERKLRRVKTTSSALDQEIKLYEQHLVEELKDLNLEGNDWIGMKMNSKTKKEWRKRNQNEVKEYKGNSNNTFFHRKLTTDFQTQKKRIISNIKKLRLKSKNPSKKHSSSQSVFSIAELLPVSQISSYERQNQFVQRVWSKSQRRRSSLHENQQNLRRSKLIQSHDDKKKGEERWVVNLEDLSKFKDQYQSLADFRLGEKAGLKHGLKPKTRKASQKLRANEQKTPLKLDRKWPQNTKQNNPNIAGIQNALPCDKIVAKSILYGVKDRQMNIPVTKDKPHVKVSKQSRKLVL